MGDLEQDLQQVAEKIGHGSHTPPVAEIVERGTRRHRRRVGVAATVAATSALAVGAVLLPSPAAGPQPQVLGTPDATAATETDAPAPDDTATTETPVSTQRWSSAIAGATIDLDRDVLDALAPVTGDPVEIRWSDDAAAVVTAASFVSPKGDGAQIFTLQHAVGVSGGVLSAASHADGDVVLARPGGTADVVADLDLASIRSVAAVPAGGWLVSGATDDGAAQLVRLDRTGATIGRATLTPTPPEAGGMLQVRGTEVWLVNSFERVDLDRGPQATLVSPDGGTTLLSQVDWRPADEAVPQVEPADLLNPDGRTLATVDLDGGPVTVAWTGLPLTSDLTIHPYGRAEGTLVPGTPTLRSYATAEDETPASSLGDVLIVADQDQVHVGRLDPTSHADGASQLTTSPDGRLWHLTITTTSLIVRQVVLP